MHPPCNPTHSTHPATPRAQPPCNPPHVLVGQVCLQKGDFPLAEKAFVHCGDYCGIQFVKRLLLLDDPKKQGAEVATHF
jgi:hypothetical protein